MLTKFQCDQETIAIRVPDDAIVYISKFPAADRTPAQCTQDALARPCGSSPLADLVRRRRAGNVVVVVSDITRPIPYATFLPNVLATIESAGVRREEILILIATGMHRSSSQDERRQILGGEIAAGYRIEDHDSTAADLVELPGKTWSGNTVRLNRRFVEAGFRIITGLVEPHFMAGFSGGRKSVCPGLANLATLSNFHGYEFLANPKACGGNLEGNPCHLESLSVARQIGVDFSLNVVLNNERQVLRAFAGELEASHEAACKFAASCVCPPVKRLADVAITSSGGYPLDTTFYQCVKGFVGCLPAVRPGGQIIAFGGCREGIGSSVYAQIMFQYSNRWKQFLSDISRGDQFFKDQWEFQMHARALERVGRENLHFLTPGIPQEQLAKLTVAGHTAKANEMEQRVQKLVDQAAGAGKVVAVFPEGPYCAPVEA